MGSTVLRFEGFEGNFINEKQLQLTVKLTPVDPRGTSYGDVLTTLEVEKVRPEDILGLYKESAKDNSYQVFLANDAALKYLLDKKVISNGKTRFTVTSMAEQVVKVRVHWLPLYYDNRILKAIFCDYGEIIDIKMCKSSYANVVAMNGTREVTLRTTEVYKQKIPHLVTFDSGQSALITMPGRPPLCLKCRCVGHVRKDCTLTAQRRSWSDVAQGVDSQDRAVSPVDAGTAGSQSAEPVGPSELAPGSSAGGAVGSAADVAEPGGPGNTQANDTESDTEMADAQGSSGGSTKRALDTDEDYITPNKTAKSIPHAASQELSSSNQFALLVGSQNLTDDNDQTNDDA